MALEYFLQRERTLLGPRFETLLTPPAAEPVRGVTVNTLRCPPQRLAESAGLPLSPSPFCQNSFVLTDPACRPGLHPYHHAGAFYVQEPSAAAPAALLDVQPGERVLDMCAAPGGKSSQLAAALQGRGLLVSNEYAAPRAEILKSNLERMGVPNALILNETPARIAQVFPRFFDRVLVDAPCSGEGMFRKEEQAVRQHGPALVQQCAALGREILDAAAACLAPGGTLVYSTCTFAPEEDEGQIGAFLARHSEFSLRPTTEAFGLPGEENRMGETPYPVQYTRRIWPGQGGEGHFMAKLQKSGESTPPRSIASGPSGKYKPIPVWQDFVKTYFSALAQQPARLLNEAVLLPLPGLPPLKKLHIVREGVFAGSLQKGRFVPGHQLFMVYGASCANREELTLHDERTLAWLRGEEIEARTAQNGWCAVLVDGYPLGGGKVSGGRIKNHYPKALRNRK